MQPFNVNAPSFSVECCIYLGLDVSLVITSGLLAKMLVPDSPWSIHFDVVQLTALTVLGGIIILFSQTHLIKRQTLETRLILHVGAISIALSCAALAIQIFATGHFSVSGPIIFGMSFYTSALALRVLIFALAEHFAFFGRNAAGVAIYGAGEAGVQLASALIKGRQARPVCFVDDNPALQGLKIAGLPVHAPSYLSDLIRGRVIHELLFAIPSLRRDEQQRLLRGLSAHSVPVRVLPPHPDLISSHTLLESLTLFSDEALMDRDQISLNTPAIAKTYAGRTVLVTGAGGSIGSELCQQLLHCRPAKIVLLDHSEYALFKVSQSLFEAAVAHHVTLKTCLGSVVERQLMQRCLEEHEVDIVIHAAAYKHVPLVEANPFEGARNNVLGTQVVAETAVSAGVERLMLVSTDKAVRPASIMGATKRMAELIVQEAQSRAPLTKCAIVRFGNVLGSSGSVVPLFQRQILAGGPVTVTHPDMKRYFMTISEAVCLLLTTGTFTSAPGDVFVLDMGKPQRILDLAHRMIALSGRNSQPRAPQNKGIAVEITGVRPGEKLTEELTRNQHQLTATPHPKVMLAQENRLSQIEVAAMLRDVRHAIDTSDVVKLRKVIRARVEGYHRSDVDDLAM
ncbi:MAG: nucleoside-diphosphate sugar epimerase/dehydratase [Pseudomonadota bacterium]